MRLIHINRPSCHHISEAMPGIKAIYQMETEFHPYLVVDFMPNKTTKPGIILQTKSGNFWRDYTFEDPRDINRLRNLIWYHLKKDYHIRDITNRCGCIEDFRPTTTYQVIDSWAQKRRQVCTTDCYDSVPDFYPNHPKDKTPSGIKHQIYNLVGPYHPDKSNKLNERQCVNLRNKICDRNFPTDSIQNRRCKEETTYYCHHRYAPGQRRYYKDPTHCNCNTPAHAMYGGIRFNLNDSNEFNYKKHDHFNFL